MEIFLENGNWIPTVLLLLVSTGAWAVGFILGKKNKTHKRGVPTFLLSALSLLANIILIFLILVWGGGLEHIIAVLMLSLLALLY